MYELYGEGRLYEQFLPRQRLGSIFVILKKTLSRINSKTRRKAMKNSDFGVFSIEIFPIKISEKALMCRTSEFAFSENS